MVRKARPDEAPTLRRRTPFDVLRDRYADADAMLRVAGDGEQGRAAILMALMATLEFLKAAKFPKPSTLLHLFVELSGLSIGQPTDIFKKSAGHGLTTSEAQRDRDTFIAVAFKLLTKGGRRKGNMTRDEAGRFIAKQLQSLAVNDRGRVFSASRVRNIYLAVSKTHNARWPSRAPTSPIAVANAVARDVAQRRPHQQFTNIIEACDRLIPGSLGTLADRKAVAVRFIRAAADLS